MQWGTPENQIIRPQSCDSGILVLDFIAEKDGYLRLTDEESAAARESDPNIRMAARTLIEYWEAHDGCWTGSKFMQQMESAVRIAEVKYPRERGYHLF